MVEQVLRDLAAADARWAVVSLRYFNPIGAASERRDREDPNDIPNNLSRSSARWRRASGRGWPCRRRLADPDGTGVRDYLHVVDLRGHLRRSISLLASRFAPVNLGTGRVSVLQLVRAFEAATGQASPSRSSRRRPGDIASAGPIRRPPHGCSLARERGIGGSLRRRLALAEPQPDGYRGADAAT